MRAENAIMWALGLIGIGSVVSAAAWRLSTNATPGVPAQASAAPSSSAARAPSPPRKPGETFTPTFAWPSGKLGKVEVTQSRERTDLPLAQAAATYEISVEALADGKRRINFGAPKPVAIPGQPTPQPIDLLNPPLIVAKDGSLVGLDDEQKLVQQLVESVSRTPGAPPAAQLGPLMAAVVQARAHNGWDSLVATWSGMTLPVHGEHETVITDLAPTPDSAPLRITTTIRTEGPVPCTPEGAPQCVKITSIGVPDAAAAKVLAGALQQQLGPNGAALQFKSLEIRVSLITEPNTLLPHSHELERRFTVELSQGQETKLVTQVERQVQKFTYAAQKP